MKKSRGKRATVRKIAFKTPAFCGGLKAKVLCVPKISDKPGPESPKFVKPTNTTFPGWEELVQPPSGAGRGHPEEGHPRQHPHGPHSHPHRSGGSIPLLGPPAPAWSGDTGQISETSASGEISGSIPRSWDPVPIPGVPAIPRDPRRFPIVSLPVPGVPLRDLGQLPAPSSPLQGSAAGSGIPGSFPSPLRLSDPGTPGTFPDPPAPLLSPG